MLSLSLLTENKIASVGAVAIVTGVVILISASAIDAETPSDDQASNISKKKTLLAVGGSLMSMGVLAQVYDQFTRYKGRGSALSSSQYNSSSQMSPAELSRFQDRVSAAAAKLRRSIGSESSRRASPSPRKESAAELAARASAQISSFIQNYS
jgi:cell division protein YceG involved in septum cleavage